MFVVCDSGYVLPFIYPNEAEAESALIKRWMKSGTIFGLVWEGEGDEDELEFLRQHLPNFDARMEGRTFDQRLSVFSRELCDMPRQGLSFAGELRPFVEDLEYSITAVRHA